MKLGLYGGAFNPIHRCHLIVAETVREQLALDRVLFIPTGDAPHKPSAELLPAVDRLEMVKLAIAGFPYFQVSDIETTRPQKSYSIDTIQALKQQFPSDTAFLFIVGLDAFLDVPNWKDPEAVLSACDFAVVTRPGSSFRSLEKLPLLAITDAEALGKLDSGEVRVARFDLESGRALWGLSMPPCHVSAKDIRRRLRAHQDLGNTLPEAVQSYIVEFIQKGGGSAL
jgi:nicotinate-nucleotide adenylyltransferase